MNENNGGGKRDKGRSHLDRGMRCSRCVPEDKVVERFGAGWKFDGSSGRGIKVRLSV